MTPQQKVIWTVNVSLREQLLMLRILDVYGKNESFYATLDDVAKAVNMNRWMVARTMKGLKEIGWLESQRVYVKRGDKNMPSVKNCYYKFLI